MKKVISMAIATAMVATCGLSVFAIGSGESTNADVKGTYVAGAETQVVYQVDVEWGAMEFTYTAASEGDWDTETHTYKDATDAAWTVNGNTVTVTNHSNADVDADFAYENATGVTGITGEFDTASKTLTSAVGKAVADADKVTATLTLSGDLADTTAAGETIGNVTVTID